MNTGYDVPRFDNAIPRPSLESLVNSASGPLIAIVAPAGFGKTILAARVCEGESRRVVWLPMSDESIDSCTLLDRICTSVCGESSCELGGCLQGSGKQSRACRERATPSVVVMDDLSPDGDPDELASALSTLRTKVLCPERIIITSRSDSLAWVSRLTPSLVVDARDLTLDEASARAMAVLHGRELLSERQLAEVREVARGHAATIGVVARRMSLQPDAETSGLGGSLDLASHLQALAAAQLSTECRQVLYAATLLRAGDLVDLESVVGRRARAAMRRIEGCVPLVRWSESGACSFAVHELGRSAFLENAFVTEWIPDAAEIVARALRVLEASGIVSRLFDLLILLDDSDQVAVWMEKRGRDLVEQGHLRAADAAFSLLSPDHLIGHPSLLLLQSEVLRLRSNFSSAMTKATVALDLAGHHGDSVLEAKAHLLIARLCLDQARHECAAKSLRSALTTGALTEGERALAYRYIMLCESDVGEAPTDNVNADPLPPEAVVQIRTVRGCLNALLRGDMRTTLEELLALRQVEGISRLLLIQNEGNIGATLVAMGRLDRALACVEDVIVQCQESEMHMLKYPNWDSLACIRAAQGDYDGASELMLDAIRGSQGCGDYFQAAWGLAHLSSWTRASGDPAKALDYAEQAAENAGLTSWACLKWVADLEVGANLAAIGESETASQRLLATRAQAKQASAVRYVRQADLLLGILDGLAAGPSAGVNRIRAHFSEMCAHEDFWMPGMYARAFPILVPILQESAGNGGLPSRLSGMIPEETVRASLQYCDDELSIGGVGNLLADIGSRGHRQCPPVVPPLRVRMFGGLEVTVGDRTVAKGDWRKTRARLMLAILVLEQGREVSRDHIAGHFWPEMDDEHARNNFYVAWSAMKSALLPGSGKKNKLPYFESAHGLCRAKMECIDADIVEFARALRAAADATAANDVETAASACERLAEIYRGELLPGDVYDDWFSSARDRYRRQFGDAILATAAMLVASGHPARAAALARHGIEADSWREDLYQVLLRAQINNGQRSAAIDTYMSCRTKLADELGLDPSSETVLLYQEVLAMEEQGPAFGSGDDSD